MNCDRKYSILGVEVHHAGRWRRVKETVLIGRHHATHVDHAGVVCRGVRRVAYHGHLIWVVEVHGTAHLLDNETLRGGALAVGLGVLRVALDGLVVRALL